MTTWLQARVVKDRDLSHPFTSHRVRLCESSVRKDLGVITINNNNNNITFISIAQIQLFSFQMCFTILEEIKSTLPKSLFLQSLFTNQIKSNVGF